MEKEGQSDDRQETPSDTMILLIAAGMVMNVLSRVDNDEWIQVESGEITLRSFPGDN